MSELKEKLFLTPKLLCWCSDFGQSLFNKIYQDCLKNHSMPSYINLPNLNLIITYKLSVQIGTKKVLALSKILNIITGGYTSTLCSLRYICIFNF